MIKNSEWTIISGPAGGNIDWDLGNDQFGIMAHNGIPKNTNFSWVKMKFNDI